MGFYCLSRGGYYLNLILILVDCYYNECYHWFTLMSNSNEGYNE